MREMKDSGVAWIGEIPATWPLIRFKDKYRSIKEIAGDNVAQYERLALTLNGVIRRPKEDDKGLQPKEFSGYQILRENDFIFKMIDLQNISTSRVGLSPYTGLVSPAYIRFTSRNENSFNLFTYYFLMSMYYNCVFNSLGGDGVRSALNASDMGTLMIPYPAESIQKEIANRIENGTKKVDALIANQEQQIEKLKAYKQSLITEIVTKGLNPDAPMKSSGANWLGLVPNSYSLLKLRNIAKLITDGTHQTPEYIQEGYKFLSIKDISTGKIDFSNVKYISKEEHDELYKSTPVEKGDMLFTRIGTLGIFLIVDTDEVFDIFVSVGLIKFKENIDADYKKYLMYYFSSINYLNYINLVKAGGGTSAAKFNLEDVRNSIIAVPQKQELSSIVRILDERCAKIDRLIEIKQQKIDKLNDYKKSLIYEYVTGKKEV